MLAAENDLNIINWSVEHSRYILISILENKFHDGVGFSKTNLTEVKLFLHLALNVTRVLRYTNSIPKVFHFPIPLRGQFFFKFVYISFTNSYMVYYIHNTIYNGAGFIIMFYLSGPTSRSSWPFYFK